MQAVVITARNPYHPALDREVKPVRRRIRIAKLAPKTDQPFICLYNGAPLLRDQWDTTFTTDKAVIVFAFIPQGGGGGGSDPLRMVLTIAVMTTAVWAGPAAFGAGFGTSAVTAGAFGTSAFGAAAVSVGAMMGGTMLLNAIMPPNMPGADPNRLSEMAAPSPTYSLQAQGNGARLGQPIPVQYGYHKSWPDFAASPYTEYAGNEQDLYQLLMLGQGGHEIHEIGIEDTPIAVDSGGGLVATGSFDGITWEIVRPGESVALFPASVTTALEVSGQELLYNEPVGGFVINAAGTTINRVGFDLVCPRGLYYANDAGGMDARSVMVSLDVRLVDDLGVAIGDWIHLATETISEATNTPQRRTYHYDVAAGRYEGRATRTNTKDTSARSADDVVWASCRGYHPGEQQYGQRTLIALKMRASNSLSMQASRRIYVKSTRELNSWHPDTGWTTTPTATRAIAWAIADACKATGYGMELADSRINLNQLYTLHQIWETRGDTFDARFDSLSGWWEAVQQIARAGRAKAFQQSGIIHCVRDQAATLPVALFCHRNILPNSMSVEYIMPDSDTADGVTMEYFDGTIWKDVPVTVPIGATQPGEDKIFGVTNRAQATREAWYQHASNQYRRKFITLQTELEGYIPTFLDPIAISHERVKWGQSGDVVSWTAGTKTLVVDEPLTWTPATTHYICLRRRDCSLTTPFIATQGANASTVILSALPDFTPYVGSNEERTTFTFGPGNGVELYQLARVLAIRPRGDNVVEIYSVAESAAVHTADSGEVPALPAASLLPSVYTSPVITDLRGVITGDSDQARVSLSWFPAPGGENYYVEISYDGMASWARVKDTTSTEYSMLVDPRHPFYMRVAAVGLTVGPWETWSSEAEGTIVPPNVIPRVSGLELFGQGNNTEFTGRHAKFVWRETSLTRSYDFDAEPNGADSGARDLYFMDFEVRILDGNTLLRTEHVTDNFYEYTYEKNAEDYAGQNSGAWGAYRTFTIEVYQRGRSGQISPVAAKMTVTNPAPGNPSGISTRTSFKTIFVTYVQPTDLDWRGVRVWVGAAPGFTKDATTLVYTGPDTTIVIDALTDGSQLATGTSYYVALQAFDAFDYSGSPSVEVEVVTEQVGDAEIKELTLDKVLSGSFVGKDFLVGAGGQIRSGQTAWNTGTGWWLGMDGQGYVQMSVGSPTGPGWDWDEMTGVLNFRGSLTVTGGAWSSQADPTKFDGGNIHATSTITTGNTAVADGNFYSVLTGGDIVFYDCYGGSFKQYKSLKKNQTGVCTTGQTVNVGYFRDTPTIIISPKGLASYNPTYANQGQKFVLDAVNIRKSGDDWLFDPVCELQLSASSITGGTCAATQVAVSPAVGWYVWSPEAYTASVNTGVSNVSRVTVTAHLNFDLLYTNTAMRVALQVYNGSWTTSGVTETPTVSNSAGGTISYDYSLSADAQNITAFRLIFYIYGFGTAGATGRASITASTLTLSAANISVSGQANYMAIG